MHADNKEQNGNQDKSELGDIDKNAVYYCKKEHINNLEYNLIKQALEDAGGVVAHAASRLKLRRTTLVEKMRKYGLQRSDEVT